MPPTKPGKAGIVAIGGDPLNAVLDGQRCVVGIGNEIPSGICLPAEVKENRPVPGAGSKDRHAGMIPEHAYIRCRRVRRRWGIEDLGMSEHPQAAAQGEFRHAAAVHGIEPLLEPRAILRVPRCILPVSVHDHVHVEQDHRSSMTSSRLAESSRSTPG